MRSARIWLGEVRTRRRSRRAAGPSASTRRAASSQNTGAREYQRVRLDGDEMAADADDSDAGDYSETFMSRREARQTPQAERSLCGGPGPGVYGAVSERRAIEPDAWGADLEWYRETRLSPAVQVGELLFVAGCTGAAAAVDGPRAQMRRAYEEIGQVLDAAGASWDDVVSMTTYHVHFRRDIDAMTEIHREFVTKEPFPAWTAVGVTALYEPEAIVEISVHALVPRGQLGE